MFELECKLARLLFIHACTATSCPRARDPTSTLSSLEAAEDSGWSGVANRSAPVVIRSPTVAEEQKAKGSSEVARAGRRR